MNHERGYALAELLVAMVVLALLLASTFLVVQTGQNAYVFGAARSEVQQNARVALNRMLRELRTGTQVTAADAQSITFTFVDDTAATVNVTYSLANTDDTGHACTPTCLQRGATTLIGGVKSLALTYFDANNTATATPANVYAVDVTLTTQSEELPSTSPVSREAVLQGRVALRNKS